MKKLLILIMIFTIVLSSFVYAEKVTEEELKLLEDINLRNFLDMYEDLKIERDILVIKDIMIQMEPKLDKNKAKNIATVLYEYSKHYDLDVLWVLAMAHVESNFRSDVVSKVGAIGLLQIMPSTAKHYGVKDKDELYDIHTNVNVGVKYLRYLVDKFNSVEIGTIAYNQGEGNVSRGTYNRRYLDKVKNRYEKIIEIKTSNY